MNTFYYFEGRIYEAKADALNIGKIQTGEISELESKQLPVKK